MDAIATRVSQRLEQFAAIERDFNGFERACREIIHHWCEILNVDFDQNVERVRWIVRRLCLAQPSRARWVCCLVDEAVAGLQSARRGDQQPAMRVLMVLQPEKVARTYQRMLQRELRNARASQVSTQVQRMPASGTCGAGAGASSPQRPGATSGGSNWTQPRSAANNTLRQTPSVRPNTAAQAASITAEWKDGKSVDEPDGALPTTTAYPTGAPPHPSSTSVTSGSMTIDVTQWLRQLGPPIPPPGGGASAANASPRLAPPRLATPDVPMDEPTSSGPTGPTDWKGPPEMVDDHPMDEPDAAMPIDGSSRPKPTREAPSGVPLASPGGANGTVDVAQWLM
jgi:hypothetical protein